MKVTDPELIEIYQTATAHQVPNKSGCPTADQLYSLSNGEFEDQSRTEMIEHISICSNCAQDFRIAKSFSDSAENQATHSPSSKWLLAAAAVVIVVLSVVLYRSTFIPESRPLRIAFTDIENHTGNQQMDALSGLLSTSLEQSQKFKVIPRSYIFDALRLMNKKANDKINRSSALQIAKAQGIDALAIPSIWNLYNGYVLRIVLVEAKTDQPVFSVDEKIDSAANIGNGIDNLIGKLRANKKDNLENMRKINDITTSNLAAYDDYYRGDLFLHEMEFEKAEQEYQKAIQLDPEFALAYYKLAFARWSREELSTDVMQKAIKYIHRAPEKEKAQIRAYNAYLKGDSKLALKIYEQLQQQHPEDRDILYMIGDLAFHQANYVQAETFMKKVLQQQPEHPLAWNHLLWSLEAEGKFSDLLKFAKRYTDQTGSLRAHKWQGDALNLLGDFRNAQTLFLKAEKTFSESTLPPIVLAEDVLVFQEKYSEAEQKILKELTKRKDKFDQRDLYRSLSRIHAYQGRYNEVITSSDRVIQLNAELNDQSDLARAYAQKAFWLIVGRDDRIAAQAAIAESMSADQGKDSILYSYLLTDHLLLGNWNDASILSQKLFGYKWGENLNRAFRSREQGIYQSAIDEFSRMNQEGERLAPILRTYGEGLTFYEAQRYEDSIKAFETLQKTYLNYFGYRAAFYPISFYYRGLNYEKLNRPKEAKAAFDHFLTLWKDADADLVVLRDAALRLRN